jgi:hypothetical protein
MKGSFTPISLLYIWPTQTKSWNFASAAAFPLAWLEVEARGFPWPFSVRKKDSTFGLFDLAFTPIVASHHFSQTDHIAFDFTFLGADRIVQDRPTGKFEPEQLDVHSWRGLHKVSSSGEY